MGAWVTAKLDDRLAAIFREYLEAEGLEIGAVLEELVKERLTAFLRAYDVAADDDLVREGFNAGGSEYVSELVDADPLEFARMIGRDQWPWRGPAPANLAAAISQAKIRGAARVSRRRAAEAQGLDAPAKDAEGCE